MSDYSGSDSDVIESEFDESEDVTVLSSDEIDKIAKIDKDDSDSGEKVDNDNTGDDEFEIELDEKYTTDIIESITDNTKIIVDIDLKKKKHKLFYNKMSRLEYISILCDLTQLYKGGMSSLVPELTELQDNYEYCNEETLAVITILKLRSNMCCVKGGGNNKNIMSVNNYPIDDVILNFKYYYPYMSEIPYIYKQDPLKKYFPTIIKNINNINITEEERLECMSIKSNKS